MLELRETKNRDEVRIVDISIPFWSMVSFMVKWAVATIPALGILAVIGIFLYDLFLLII